MKSKLIIATSIVALLTGCATTGTGGSGKGDRLYSKNAETLDTRKDVYIAQFAVSFVTKDSGSSKSTSPMIRHSSGSEYAQSVLKAHLTGVPNSTFQKIADEAYNDFVADLTAKGFNVKPVSDLQKLKPWKKLDPLPVPYTPSGVSSFMKNSSQDEVTFSASSLNLFSVPDQVGQVKPMPYAFSELAEAAGAPVFAINYKVHFAYFDKDTDYEVNYFKDVPLNGGPSSTLSASVTLGQGIQVTTGSAAQFLVDSGGTFSDNGYVSLIDPVIVGGAYGRNEDTTSGSQKAANAFSSAVGFFTGGSTKTTEISVVATPEYYQYGAIKAIDMANNRIVDGLIAK
ncbi:MAG: hypothetical protein HWE24_06010 [Oceanospirillaceae bacterium]|nr:hypothetical protein [Oceanospirillaceae bacterium]